MELKNRTAATNYEQIFQEKTGQSFNKFYNKYYTKLVWQLRKLNITDLDAQGLANDAFMQSLEKIEQYNPAYNFSTWLFTVGRNLALQFKKDNSKIILVDTSDNTQEDKAVSGMNYYLNMKIDNSTEVIENQNITLKKYDIALKNIASLDVKYREYIELCDIQGKSYDEICDLLGVELQTVKNRLHHGRKKIELQTQKQFKQLVTEL
jgi:RNA polymerase sigma-70 factor (ECF subfamily)